MGPASVRSIGGAAYLMLIVDGGTSRMTGYFLTWKSAELTLEVFTTYHIESKRQTGCKLLKVWIDAGREWINNLWQNYSAKTRIVIVVTTLYAHAQNGLVERCIRTVIEGIRCMLTESGLPKDLWAEAASTQIYTQNCLPSSWHPNQIPEQAWTGKHLSMAHLCPFSCTAFAKIPQELIQSKLDPQLVKYVFVGYSSNGYRLFD